MVFSGGHRSYNPRWTSDYILGRSENASRRGFWAWARDQLANIGPDVLLYGRGRGRRAVGARGEGLNGRPRINN